MPSPITPSDFADAVPSANADFCDRFSKFLNVPALLRDFFLWFLNSDGSLSAAFKTEMASFTNPTGSVIFSLSANVGDAFLLMDGSEISRSDYPALFAAIGTRYGSGNGTTTFTLPDARGRCLIGAGAGAGLSFRDLNSPYLGDESITLAETQIPPHVHSWDGPASRVEERGTGANLVWRGTLAAETGSTGGGQPHSNMQPSLVGFYFIKT